MKVSFFVTLCCMLCFGVGSSQGFVNSTSAARNRNGRFLFDTLFGLESVANEEEDEEEVGSNVKDCNCGEFDLGCLIWLEIKMRLLGIFTMSINVFVRILRLLIIKTKQIHKS